MKIIKQGKPKEEVGIKVECSNCNSELEYSERDIVTRSQTLKDRSDFIINKYIVCPVCNTSIDLK